MFTCNGIRTLNVKSVPSMDFKRRLLAAGPATGTVPSSRWLELIRDHSPCPPLSSPP